MEIRGLGADDVQKVQARLLTTSFCGTTTADRAKTSSVTPAPPFCGIARKWSASSPASASCFWSLRRSCC
ncbi:unnamed protein product [Acanthoscelides obtectus]|uniref:Uncharacterized protein n=1 Tax=Acanthoscelides obtectus TaxID=200917 RepID=A0A9P0PVC9_ACAOB|nr:unnamed protein product [Acanthoscelides obtectus]CAK1682244.1 hypothetical protein AOBTE_LOCUS33508 [Acanthoscelides obtectus]